MVHRFPNSLKIFSKLSKKPGRQRSLYRLLGIFLLMLVGLFSCGYHREGRPQQWSSWRTIALPVWENPTADIRFGEMMAAALRERFALSGFLKQAPKDKADLVLEGKVLSIGVGGLSYDVYTQTLERRVNVRVKVCLRERKTNRVIWEATLSRFQDYPVTQSESGTVDPGREEALVQMARDLADIIYHRLLSRF